MAVDVDTKFSGAEVNQNLSEDAGLADESVVTKDIPAGVLAAGNPCNVIREISEKDSMYLKQ